MGALDRRTVGRWYTRIVAHRAIHQDVTHTKRDRYPRLFDSCRTAMGAAGRHRILSYGCASGEEVLSLRDYFPNATIVGAEINPIELATCRQRATDPGIVFIRSVRRRVAAHGPYDMIFCMAVLQRRPEAVARAGLTTIARHYPFARFADEIGFLAAQIEPGGLLIVEHSQYRVEDSPAAQSLDAVAGMGDWPPNGPRFDQHGALILPPPPVSRIFRKRALH